jgi:DNA-binding NarL/FixJ family response regulator
VEEFDLAIVDLELGTGEGMTGYELIAQIKERRPKMRVVVLTGCSLPESERAARRQGADAYWEKTAPPSSLLERLREWGFPADPEDGPFSTAREGGR